MPTKTVSEAMATRRSVRAFLDKPVDLDVLTRVMDKARMAPSGCNFQPWQAEILSGAPLRELQDKLIAAATHQPAEDPPEYIVTPVDICPPWTDRLFEVGTLMYAALGIARDDKESRSAFFMQNMRSFGAPAVLFCYLPRLMNECQWSDMGMWLQSIMLLLREEGLDSCPQEALSMRAQVIKSHLGIDDRKYVFFCGLGIGYRDPDAPVNQFPQPRVPLAEQVRFHGF